MVAGRKTGKQIYDQNHSLQQKKRIRVGSIKNIGERKCSDLLLKIRSTSLTR